MKTNTQKFLVALFIGIFASTTAFAGYPRPLAITPVATTSATAATATAEQSNLPTEAQRSQRPRNPDVPLLGVDSRCAFGNPMTVDQLRALGPNWRFVVTDSDTFGPMQQRCPEDNGAITWTPYGRLRGGTVFAAEVLEFYRNGTVRINVKSLKVRQCGGQGYQLDVTLHAEPVWRLVTEDLVGALDGRVSTLEARCPPPSVALATATVDSEGNAIVKGFVDLHGNNVPTTVTATVDGKPFGTAQTVNTTQEVNFKVAVAGFKAGTYQVVLNVSNACGTSASQPATLTVSAPNKKGERMFCFRGGWRTLTCVMVAAVVVVAVASAIGGDDPDDCECDPPVDRPHATNPGTQATSAATVRKVIGSEPSKRHLRAVADTFDMSDALEARPIERDVFASDLGIARTQRGLRQAGSLSVSGDSLGASINLRSIRTAAAAVTGNPAPQANVQGASGMANAMRNGTLNLGVSNDNGDRTYSLSVGLRF